MADLHRRMDLRDELSGLGGRGPRQGRSAVASSGDVAGAPVRTVWCISRRSQWGSLSASPPNAEALEQTVRPWAASLRDFGSLLPETALWKANAAEHEGKDPDDEEDWGEEDEDEYDEEPDTRRWADDESDLDGWDESEADWEDEDERPDYETYFDNDDDSDVEDFDEDDPDDE